MTVTDNDYPSDSDDSLLQARTRNDSPREDAGALVDGNDIHVLDPNSSPTSPSRPFREEVVNEILDLTDQIASVGLFGPIGIGKTVVADTALHHNRTKAKFGQNRHFMRCDDLALSLEAFIERLSIAIDTNATQLQLRLQSSPPLILLLDGVDFILDSQSPEAEKISATIEEFGSYEHVCLVTTSRIYPDIRGFHRAEIPILSEDDARDTFHSLCNLDRSLEVDNLIAKWDFHPLSIELLASSVRDNNWDEPALLKAWREDQTSASKRHYYQRLKDAIEPILRSPTIQRLGTTARDVLEAIATFPSGVEERELQRIFHKVGAVTEVVDVLCKFSLIRQEDGTVKMLSPFQFYFRESMLVLAQTKEVIHVGPDCMPAQACMLLPLCSFHRV